MLLNELQKQNARVQAEEREIAELKAQRADFEARLSALERATEVRNARGGLVAAFNK